ncbi:hypothetical protein GCM10025789_19890 [Tessaracoccus lubricantis]|uniref:Uncharacterized protein n=1 Tax=Tessaracoccus lubricantis TaxID=545543 RepID=A0ABP9FGQ5_9ACTN
MVVAVLLCLAAVAGIVTGVSRRKTSMVIVSTVLLILVIAGWVYFYQHPY